MPNTRARSNNDGSSSNSVSDNGMPPVQHAAPVLVSAIRVGDRIMTGGKAGKAIPVRRLRRGESCNGMHVNDEYCYDRCATVMVARDV